MHHEHELPVHWRVATLLPGHAHQEAMLGKVLSLNLHEVRAVFPEPLTGGHRRQLFIEVPPLDNHHGKFAVEATVQMLQDPVLSRHDGGFVTEFVIKSFAAGHQEIYERSIISREPSGGRDHASHPADIAPSAVPAPDTSPAAATPAPADEADAGADQSAAAAEPPGDEPDAAAKAGEAAAEPVADSQDNPAS